MEKKSRRRIDDPDDIVAWEVTQALGRGMRVIKGVRSGCLPLTAQALPPTIFALAMRQAYSLRHDSCADDVGLLSHHIITLRRARATLGGDWPASDLAR